METGINATKTQNKLYAYNYDVIAQILDIQKMVTDGEGEPPDDAVSNDRPGPGKGKTEAPPVDRWTWRHMPTIVMEDMIICTCGTEAPQHIDVARKAQDNTIEENERPLIARRELDIIQDKCHSDTEAAIKYFCIDFPGAQFSKDYYLERIKSFLNGNKTDGATIWYTGNSERGTGNWCFKDGVVTFDDIFSLYMDHFRGKRLTVISDCSYSGQWVVDCVDKMDEMGIPSCGHHTREQGILLKIFGSCLPTEEASASVYVEAITVKDQKIRLPAIEKLPSGQTPTYGDFRAIRCRKRDSETCEIGSENTWKDRIINKSNNVYLVRGKDRGKPAWHYVLVDEQKVDSFKTQVATGNIDVANYGRVIYSGWGEDPPQEKRDMIDKMFLDYIHPE